MASKTKLYDDISDSEIIYQIEENNQDAKEYLYQKYAPLVHKEVDKFYKQNKGKGIEFSDLLQEGMLAFSEAVNNYDNYSDVKFITFATVCIQRKLKKYTNKYSTQKHKQHLAELSLDSENADSEKSLKNIIKDTAGKEPLNKVITDEALNEVYKNFSKLTNQERKVISYSIEGKEPSEIAKIMDISTKKVYNLVYRARVKMKLKREGANEENK